MFPKALLYGEDYARPQVNAVANFALLTSASNKTLGKRPPSEYFPEAASAHRGVLTSQWIPDDRTLWDSDHYLDFLAARRQLSQARPTNCSTG